MRKGDVLALLDAKHPRGTWKLARVTEVFAAADGVVRSAEIKIVHVNDDKAKGVTTSTLQRPVHKMVLLIPAEQSLCLGPALLKELTRLGHETRSIWQRRRNLRGE